MLTGTTEMRTQTGSNTVTENITGSAQGPFAPPSEPVEISTRTDHVLRGTSNVVTSSLGKVAIAPVMAELDTMKKALAEMAAGQVCHLSMQLNESVQRDEARLSVQTLIALQMQLSGGGNYSHI